MKKSIHKNYWDTLDRKSKSQERFKDLNIKEINAHHADK